MLRSAFRIKRDVRKDRFGKPERATHQNLLRRVRKMILGADDMRDLHQRIVHHDRKVIERRVEIFCDDEVTKERSVKDDFAAHEVLELHFDLRHFEADGLRDFAFRRRRVAAVAAVLWRQSLRKHHLALRLDVFLGAIAVIRVAGSRSAAVNIFYRGRCARSGDTDRTRLSRPRPRAAIGRRRRSVAGLHPNPNRARKVPGAVLRHTAFRNALCLCPRCAK